VGYRNQGIFLSFGTRPANQPARQSWLGVPEVHAGKVVTGCQPRNAQNSSEEAALLVGKRSSSRKRNTSAAGHPPARYSSEMLVYLLCAGCRGVAAWPLAADVIVYCPQSRPSLEFSKIYGPAYRDNELRSLVPCTSCRSQKASLSPCLWTPLALRMFPPAAHARQNPAGATDRRKDAWLLTSGLQRESAKFDLASSRPRPR
jgi:hypothetical protein